MQTFSKKEYLVLGSMAVLLLPVILLNLHIVPLYAEEPRRAIIAMEMILRGNWLVPTIHGEYYYLKPPFFNWLLATVYTITGNFSEISTRITTVISLLLMGAVIFFSAKKYAGTTFGALSAMLFLTASGNLFFNALLAEIDIFYSLVTYTGLICIFHFHRQKKYLLLFLSVYFLGAIGILTKGLPSLAFTGLSLLVFFISVREFRRLFSLQHLAGILLFLLLTGSYFFFYSKHGDVWKYLGFLFFESGKRFSGDTALEFLEHMVLYPFDTLWNLLPASILIIFAFRRSFFRDIRENDFIRFLFLMLAIHFPVYWLPPGGRQRYIIMLYPIIIQVMAYFFLKYYQAERNRAGIFNTGITVFLALVTAGCLVPVFVPAMQIVPHLAPICMTSSGASLLLLIFHLRNARYAVLTMMFSLLVTRVFFGLVVLPVRAATGDAFANKDAALKIAGLAGENPLAVYQHTRLPLQTSFYLEKMLGKIVPVTRDHAAGTLLITESYLLQPYEIRKDIDDLMSNPIKMPCDLMQERHFPDGKGFQYHSLWDFTLQKRKFQLIRPVHPHP